MYHIRFFDEHELATLSKEDLLKLYHSPMDTVDDVRKENTDRIVEKFNKFVHHNVDNQLYVYESAFEYEIDWRGRL